MSGKAALLRPAALAVIWLGAEVRELVPQRHYLLRNSLLSATLAFHFASFLRVPSLVLESTASKIKSDTLHLGDQYIHSARLLETSYPLKSLYI